MRKFKVAAVNYLNTKPLLFGLLKSELQDQIDLRLAIPSECARLLEAGEVDFGLVPVGVLTELSSYYLFSDFCIGTEGAVKTVGLFGDVPIEKMENIYLDHHSRTSALLVRLLLEQYWKIHPKFLKAFPGFEQTGIEGSTGGLVIGDRTIGLEKKYSYFYDLGEIWHQWTGLPFVFAGWVSKNPIPGDFATAFNKAMEAGIKQIPQLMWLLQSPEQDFDLEAYFTKNISYSLDGNKKKALGLFLELARELNPVGYAIPAKQLVVK